jgi:hypothetical protein
VKCQGSVAIDRRLDGTYNRAMDLDDIVSQAVSAKAKHQARISGN